MKSIEVLLLSRGDIVGLKLAPECVVQVVEQALKEHADGTYEMHPKIGVHPTGTDPANFIHAMPAYLHRMGACGLKWVSGFARNYKVDLPNVTGVLVYNDTATGRPLGIMDCSYLTGLRTATVSAIIAQRCLAPQAEVLALVGCGFEGTMHLRFLIALIPRIKAVRLRDLRARAAAGLKEGAASYFAGEITCCDANESCVRDADVIVTCTNGDAPIIEKEWFKPGAFGVGIEGGCAYTAEALHLADKFIVDDIPLAHYFDEIGRNRLTEDGRPDPEFPGGLPPIYATIGEIVSCRKTGRESAAERIIAIPIGMAICDIALAHLIYQTAISRGVGQQFRLA
ncbi:MAG: ornithine cyclodeaminase family protein [Verrucomicrobia bacterium]|nr:ornithine cyclodeaminase family protein [Verrucomicrobiota bacterium]